MPFVPEVRLFLAGEVTPLWRATEGWLVGNDVPPPFWAFAWAGGQALARYLLDTPHVVRGARVLDFASGSGLVGIAAARAGAAHVAAVDIDPFSAAACALNGAENGVMLEVSCEDLTGRVLAGVDVVTAGDIWYEAAAAKRFGPWFQELARAGVRVITADPGRSYVPVDGVRELARYEVPTPEDLEGTAHRTTRVLEVVAGA